MNRKIVFLFGGQGTQYFNMTQELYKRNDIYRKILDALDEKIYYKTGSRMLDYLFNTSLKINDKCDDLVLSSFALFSCQYALAKLLISMEIRPDAVVGVSMGEFVSLAIASEQNVDRIIENIGLVGSAITKKCQKGGMLVVLHNSNLFFERRDLFKLCEIAGNPYNENFVISGQAEVLDELTVILQQNIISVYRLPVQYAFHSRYIDEVKQDVCASSFPYKLDMPVGSSAYGKVLNDLPNSYEWDVIRRPMLFRETIWDLEESENTMYIDLSPGGSLANYMKYGHISDCKVESIVSAYHKENEKIEKIRNECFENRDKNYYM